MYLKGGKYNATIMENCICYIGVIVGAGLSSGQDLLQYFISFGQIGLIGVPLLGLLNAAFGKIMLSLGSYYRADNHEEVFTQISHPIITKILDFVLIAGSFIMGFVMIAGAGSNLEQQFGLPLDWRINLLTFNHNRIIYGL